jgi:hypothetical protein
MSGEEAASGELRASFELAFTLLRRWYIGKEAFDYPQGLDLDCGNFARRQQRSRCRQHSRYFILPVSWIRSVSQMCSVH